MVVGERWGGGGGGAWDRWPSQGRVSMFDQCCCTINNVCARTYASCRNPTQPNLHLVLHSLRRHALMK